MIRGIILIVAAAEFASSRFFWHSYETLTEPNRNLYWTSNSIKVVKSSKFDCKLESNILNRFLGNDCERTECTAYALPFGIPLKFLGYEVIKFKLNENLDIPGDHYKMFLLCRNDNKKYESEIFRYWKVEKQSVSAVSYLGKTLVMSDLIALKADLLNLRTGKRYEPQSSHAALGKITYVFPTSLEDDLTIECYTRKPYKFVLSRNPLDKNFEQFEKSISSKLFEVYEKASSNSWLPFQQKNEEQVQKWFKFVESHLPREKIAEFKKYFNLINK